MSSTDQNIQTLEEKIVSIARQAIGETMMGPGYFLDDGNGTHPVPYWCEAAAETIVFMATGERIRFPSAENHYQGLLSQGKIHTDTIAPAGTYVFYHWQGDADGHITVATGNDTTIGTVVNPAQILELPTNHYTGYSGWAYPQEVIDVAKTMSPADPTNGGLGFQDATKRYRVFNWIKDGNGNPIIIGNAILDFWQANGPVAGITRYGYPMSQEVQELNDKDISLTVQWFERTRLEYHPENPDPYRIEMGRLGVELVDWWILNGYSDLNKLKIEPTTDALDPRFVSYFNENGAIDVLGLPIMSVAKLPNSDFQSQALERAILEIHDESSSWPVQARRIGAEIHDLRKSGNGPRISG